MRNNTRRVERLTHMLAEAAARSGREHAEDKPAALTIALSRQSGAPAAAIAEEVGRRLNWPVYDKSLLHRIAEEMNIFDSLLESVDERHKGWMQELTESLVSDMAVSELGFTRHLVKTLLALAAKGNCLIVGRGGSLVLPLPSTLRVRLVAPLDNRIEALSKELGVPRNQAADKLQERDKERLQFMKRHFFKDPRDPCNFDLVLNTARFSVPECAEQIVHAARTLQARSEAAPIASNGL